MEEESVEPQIELEDDKTESCIVPMDIAPSMEEQSKRLQIHSGGELVVSRGDDDLEPCEGMEFESEEAARIFYNAYASHMGFRIRISKYSRSRRDNSVISRRLVCSKEGFRELRVKKGLFGDQRQRQRAVTRVGCKAMIMVKKINTGKWVVTRFVKEHNHGPVPPRKVEVRIAHDNNDLVDNSFIADGDSIQEPFEGMEFDSEEAAKSYYSAYARKMGFRARISKYCRSRRDNSIISRQIVCSKEGFREVRVKKENEIADEGKVKRSRMITRIGCKAMILVKKLNSGKWIVSRFEKEHNHALVGLDKTLHLESDTSTGKGLLLEGPSVVHASRVTGGYSAGIQGTSRESLTILYNQLCYEAIRYAQEGAVSEEIYNVAMSALKEAVEKVAAAKRKALTVAQPGVSVNGASQGIIMGHGTNQVFKSATTAKEFMFLQQPVKIMMIPSTMPSEPGTSNCSVDTPLIANMTNGQMLLDSSDGIQKGCSGQEVNITNPVSLRNQPWPTTSCAEGLVGNGSKRLVLSAREDGTNGDVDHNEAVQKSEKLDCTGEGQANAASSNGSSFVRGGTSEQLLAVPALPVALYMPVMGNLPTTCSVSTPGTPGGSYALVAAPLEALPISSRPAEASGSIHGILQEAAAQRGSLPLTPFSSDQIEPYTGPNPQVRAAAIAAGARILPPKAAASLIKAVESRIRSEGASLSISTFVGDFSSAAIMARRPRACSTNSNRGAPESVDGFSDPKVQSSDSERQMMDSEGIKLHKSPEESNELEELLVESAAAEGLTMFGNNGFAQ